MALAVVNIVLVIGSCYVVVISEKPENIGVFATGIDDKVDLWWYTTRRTKTALIIDGVKHKNATLNRNHYHHILVDRKLEYEVVFKN